MTARLQIERDEVHLPLVARMRVAGLFFLHVPNEGMRPVQHRRMLVRMGLLTGAPDLLIFDRPPRWPEYTGLALELKAPGGRASDAQREVLAQLLDRGWMTAIGYGLAESVSILRWHGYDVPVIGGI